jgi:hypothetical protein
VIEPDSDVDEFEEGDGAGVGAYPFNPWGHLFNVVQFASVIAANVSSFLAIVARDLSAHNNDLVDRRIERKQRRLLIDDLNSLERGEQP